MANNIQKAVLYLADPENLNGVYKDAALTSDLETSKVKWIGGDTVKLPFNIFGSLGNYNRASGHPALDVNRQWSTYVLSQDKGNKITVDREDLDESLVGGGIVELANDFIRQVAVPDIDTYRFGKLAANAGTKKYHTSATTDNIITANNARTKIDEARAELDNEEAGKDRILFITPAARMALEQTFTGGVLPTGVWGGDLQTQVAVYNECKVISVPSGRLGANVNFILVDKAAVLGIVKHTAAKAWLPGEVPGIDAGQVDYRVYHDFFVIPQKTKGVYVSLAQLAA